MRVLVFGGREWGLVKDSEGNEWIDGHEVLKMVALFNKHTISRTDTIVNGGAKGADTIGALVGKAFGCKIETHAADWPKYGRRAGPIRNKKMASTHIDFAFMTPGGRGTKHMQGLLLEQGVPIYEVHLQD